MPHKSCHSKPSIRATIHLLILTLLISACSQALPVTSTLEAIGVTPSPDISITPYPGAAQDAPIVVEAYPPPSDEMVPLSAYPAPGGNESPAAGTHFRIDLPVLEGATELTGAGPAGTPIQVVDISMNGSVLGNGVIGDDERFAIQLATALEANRIIGIELAIPRDSDTWTQLWELRGENARSIPNLGYYLDSIVTQPESN